MTPVADTSVATTENKRWIDSPARTDPDYWANLPQPPSAFKPLENSTAQQERPEEIRESIEALFEAAKDQVFEDGMESEFSNELISIVKKYGHNAVTELVRLIVLEKVNAEVASEALRWLGSMNHPSTYHYRLWLLERSLRCSSARVRDGATLGLSFLDDPHAISYLKKAIEREQIEELRQDMEQVLAQLESTHQCRLS